MNYSYSQFIEETYEHLLRDLRQFRERKKNGNSYASYGNCHVDELDISQVVGVFSAEEIFGGD